MRATYGHSGNPHRRAGSEARVAEPSGPESAMLGPVHGRYVAVATGGRIRFVDVIAARKQALIAELEKAAAKGPLPSRPFLVPEPHAVSETEADRFETHETLLVRLGFEFRRVGPERITLREAPLALAGAAPGHVTVALATALEALEEEAREDRIRILVRRFVEHLDLPVDWPRVGAMLQELQMRSPEPGSAPGRIWVEVSGDDIAAMFDARERR